MEKKFDKELPIFFAIDDNYLPYFLVTVNSIKKHADKNVLYSIFILSEGLSDKGMEKINSLKEENFNFTVVNLSKKIAPVKELMQNSLRDYYSVAIFYRLFIAEIFKKYDKAIYIDSDIVLLDDIEKLFDHDLGEYLVGAVTDQVVAYNDVFRDYSLNALGVEPNDYFNSGVLVMNLKEFRNQKIEEKFLDLLVKYNFETVAPDQDYLNVLCSGKVKYLSAGWNRMPTVNADCDKVFLVHYNMFDKPWKYKGVMFEEHFWEYAKDTEYYRSLLKMRENYGDDAKLKDQEGGKRLAENALKIIYTENNFKRVLAR